MIKFVSNYDDVSFLIRCEGKPQSWAGWAGMLVIAAILLPGMVATGHAQDSEPDTIRIASFEVDATPDVGDPVAYNPVKRIEKPLSARGLVLTGSGDPIVLCAVDWIGIKGRATDIWRKALARAAGTTPDRVSIHSLHQHEAPRVNFMILDIFREYGIDPAGISADNREFVERIIERSAAALRDAVEHNLQTVTHVGTGTGMVEKVASNRRRVNREGKEVMGRMSSTSDAHAQRAPVGTIDPEVRLVSFWKGDTPLAVLSYYATHPQSYYRHGGVNPDFVGIARSIFEKETGVRQIHFNGAGGNIAAGKWNNGWTEKRQILADRLSRGMMRAWQQTERIPVDASQVEWRVKPVALPLGEHMKKEELEQTLSRASESGEKPTGAARDLGWVRRSLEGDEIDITALRIGPARILHTPGELAVEYQLFAHALYPDSFIANASYSNTDPGYISTEIQYHQGGYEASDRASKVAPAVEQVLLSAIRSVLAFEADPNRSAGPGYRLERTALQYGYDGEYSWVDGRAGVIPARFSSNPVGKPAIVLMAHQIEHSGPDILQGLHYFRSRDLGLSWEGPFGEPAFKRVPAEVKGSSEAAGGDRLVRRFTPRFHDDSKTLLGIGESIIYEGNQAADDPLPKIAYATFSEQAQTWRKWKTFKLPAGMHEGNPATASGRRVDLEDGSVLFPVYSSDLETKQFRLSIVRGHFDGRSLEYIEHGNTLAIEDGAELREPSLTEFNGIYYLAFSNDEQVFAARSTDGLHFDEPQPLRSKDGQPLASDDSRQHWVAHGDNLFLAYTDKEGASLILAQVDPETLSLVGQTPQVIIPAERGGRLDNLGATRVSDKETWVTATEWIEPSLVGGEFAVNNLIHIARLKEPEPNE